MKLRRCALLAMWMLGALVGCDSPKTALRAEDVVRAARDSAALAAEGALLVRQRMDGRVSHNFTWVCQKALQEQARAVAQGIHRPTPPALRERQERLALAVGRLEVALDRIPYALDNARELAELEKLFEDARRQAVSMREDA